MATFRKLSVFLLAFSLVYIPLSEVEAQNNESVKVPSGLSDTAFSRAFDNALRDLDQNRDVDWDDGHDTPTADQLFTLYMNYSEITTKDTSVVSGSTRTDTELISRDDVPLSLYLIETFNSNGILIKYEKKITRESEF